METVSTIKSEMKVNRLTQIKKQTKKIEGKDGENLRGKQHTYLKSGVLRKCSRRSQTGLGKEAKLD